MAAQRSPGNRSQRVPPREPPPKRLPARGPRPYHIRSRHTEQNQDVRIQSEVVLSVYGRRRVSGTSVPSLRC